MLPTSRVDFIPAGKAPQRGADAVKVCYLLLGSPRLATMPAPADPGGHALCFRHRGL
jgi:hypothetical protein